MFCPSCGQERTTQATSFCSRCGFLLTGTAELLHTGGVLPQSPKPGPGSPRSRGVKTGLFMFLLMFVVAPIVGFLSMAIGLRPWPVGIAVFLLGAGGLLRMAYALMFESKYSENALPGASLHIADAQLPGRAAAAGALPPERDLPASEYARPQTGRWLDTSDLEPPSVTESTTKLLERDEPGA